MKKYKEFMKERSFAMGSLFVVFNAFLLCVLYFAVKNLHLIAAYVGHALSALASAFSPLLIGLVIAYLLNPLVSTLDRVLMQKLMFRVPEDPVKAEKRRNLTRFISVLLTFLIVIAVIVAIIYGFAVLLLGQLVFTDLSTTFNRVMATFLGYQSEMKLWISHNLPEGFVSDKLLEVANSVITWFSESFNASAAIATISNMVGGVVNVILGAIVSIYLMKDRDFFLGLWRKFLHLTMPQRTNAAITETLNEINEVLSQFVRGALLDAVIVAILSSIALSVIGLKFAVFIGVFAGIANVIPYFGPILGMIPAFIIGWLTNDLGQGILAIIVLVVVQQIDANIIYPKIVGSSTGLHPLLVLLAVSVFGYFGGIVGMLLAVPAAGIIQKFVVKWAYRKERKLEGKLANRSGSAGKENENQNDDEGAEENGDEARDEEKSVKSEDSPVKEGSTT